MQLEDRLANIEDALGQIQVTQEVTEDWLQIPFRFVSIAASAQALVTRTIAGDGPFDLVEITHTAIDANGVANDNFRIRIREGESVGRALTLDSEFVDANNTSGTAQRPYIIKGRRRFRSNIAILVEVTNTATVENTIEVVLHGFKVFTR
jgi:hypothetical protein